MLFWPDDTRTFSVVQGATRLRSQLLFKEGENLVHGKKEKAEGVVLRADAQIPCSKLHDTQAEIPFFRAFQFPSSTPRRRTSHFFRAFQFAAETIGWTIRNRWRTIGIAEEQEEGFRTYIFLTFSADRSQLYRSQIFVGRRCCFPKFRKRFFDVFSYFHYFS